MKGIALFFTVVFLFSTIAALSSAIFVHGAEHQFFVAGISALASYGSYLDYKREIKEEIHK